MNQFYDLFYSYPKILARVLRMALHRRNLNKVLLGLVTNLTCRHNKLLDRKAYALRCVPPGATSPTQGFRLQED
jgi:hypothetical protein